VDYSLFVVAEGIVYVGASDCCFPMGDGCVSNFMQLSCGWIMVLRFNS
jgi:hypothetical protein